MAVLKNTTGQGLYVYAHDTAADAAKTGDAANITAKLSLDGGAYADTNDVNPTEIGRGVYWFALTQAETNAGALALMPVSATADVVLDALLVLTQEAAITYQSGDAYARLGAPAGASVSADIAAIEAQTDDIGVAGAGLTALGDTRLANLDAAVSTRSTLDAAGVRTAVGLAAANLDTQLAELDAADDAVLAAIAALNNIDAVAAQAAAAAALAAYNAAKVGDAMGAVASVTGDVGGNVVGSVGSVTNPVTAGTVSDKTGYALAATGLDAIPITAPAGVASTFREIVVQGWRRMFKKATMTATQMVTYADDGTTPLTTQAVSDDGETQTQGAAS